VGAEGLEPSHNSSGNKTVSEGGGAESGAVDAPQDVRLVRLLDCWEDLPESVRVSVNAIDSAHLPADAEFEPR